MQKHWRGGVSVTQEGQNEEMKMAQPREQKVNHTLVQPKVTMVWGPSRSKEVEMSRGQEGDSCSASPPGEIQAIASLEISHKRIKTSDR